MSEVSPHKISPNWPNRRAETTVTSLKPGATLQTLLSKKILNNPLSPDLPKPCCLASTEGPRKKIITTFQIQNDFYIPTMVGSKVTVILPEWVDFA